MTKKRLKLKDNVKFTLLLITFLIIGLIATQLFIKRVEEIKQGDFIVISDYEMDR